jgi:hypothetical protein
LYPNSKKYNRPFILKQNEMKGLNKTALLFLSVASAIASYSFISNIHGHESFKENRSEIGQAQKKGLTFLLLPTGGGMDLMTCRQ